jgi:AcrR family transcriptional regulator
MSKRRYEKKARAAGEERTRRRIVEAAVALHGEVGPAATTVSDIARRAGVSRLTVYAHFPQDEALFRACSGHWRSQHPPPDIAAWAAVADPGRRLRRALRELYAWYAENREMLGRSTRDQQVLPALARATGTAEFQAAAAGILLTGRRSRGRRVRGELALALGFATWERLDGEGLAPRAAADLMASLVEAA